MTKQQPARRGRGTVGEKWVAVVGYEGIYEVSSTGNVRRPTNGRNLAKINTKGYHAVNLHKDGVMKMHKVHRLVLFAFKASEYFDGAHVDHIDAVRNNNAIDNLRWVTPTQNNAHRCHLGRTARGEASKKRLRESDVLGMRMLASVVSQNELARRYGVSQPTARAIILRRIWKHVI